MSLNKENSLPILGKIWDLDPLSAALFILLVDFGIVCLFMFLESIGPNSTAPPPWQRTHYKSFLFGDGIVVPIFMFAAVSFMKKYPFSGDYWFVSAWFQVVVLLLGVAWVVSMNVMDIVSSGPNSATISQLLSPSCLFHTIIFGPMFYWIVMASLGAFASIWEGNSLVVVASFQTVLVLVPILAHVGFMYWDGVLPRPWTAHVEGSWLKWDWHVRAR